MTGVRPIPQAKLELLRIFYASVVLTLCACTSTLRYRQHEPWNFPPAHEWNAPLEMSWLNAVDTWRKIIAPRGKIYDPLMRNYQPDLGALISSSSAPESPRASRP